MNSLYDLSYEECTKLLDKPYRGRQLFEALYRQKVSNIDEITTLSKDFRQQLKETYELNLLTLVIKQVASDGTTKFLFKTQDDMLLESVLMVFDYGNSVCVSTQVGCNMGCAFCASGLTKKTRDLSTAEIVSQVMAVVNHLGQERLSHIVVMGTGEPFDNYDAMMKALAIVNHDLGLAIGARHITISTCGIVPKILEFAQGKYQYNLAISLHAPNDELRNQLMPINHAYPLKTLMEALDTYSSLNNRRLTFEYILLEGINNSIEHADQLSDLLRGKNAYVNLIPYNMVDEKGFRSVSRHKAMIFYDRLMKRGIRATIRKEHGQDIDAACGQLRIKHVKKEG